MTDTPNPGAAPAASVCVDLRRLRPYATALVRWLVHGLGIWLIAHGMRQDRAADLEFILSGGLCSLGALAWSWGQKELQLRRVMRAARADPRTVQLKL